MKLLIFHFVLLFALAIANPISPVENPVYDAAEDINEIQEANQEPVEQSSRSDLEYGDHFEGDMIIPQEEEENIRSGRYGLIATKYRWPKSGGYVRVPYTINAGYTFSQYNIILSAINDIQLKTCVRFTKRTNQKDFITITHGKGCSSSVGKRGGEQFVTLQKDGCVSKGTVMHELIHALGFTHQHNHYQRDQKVKILWDNIQAGHSHNFEKASSSTYSNFNTAYDIGSIMHYKGNAFSKNGQLTIQAKSFGDQVKMGQNMAMSAGDITRIKKMYGC